MTVPAHDQKVSHSYTVHYPEHPPRESDPHYADFAAYKKRRREDGTWHCDFAAEHRGGDTSECDLTKPLECHHTHIEYSVQNGVVLMEIGAWIETAANLSLLCVF